MNFSMKNGFYYEGGKLVKYSNGRKRKNWKAYYRQKSRKFLKNKCEKCGSKKNLTIHHKIPIERAIIITKENCITLCRECHNKIHGIYRERTQRSQIGSNGKYQKGTRRNKRKKSH